MEFGLLGPRKAVIITVCAIALIVSALYFSNVGGWWNNTTTTTSSTTSSSTSPTTTTATFTTPAYAKVFGLAYTIGNGTHDTTVVFTSSSGVKYVATITNGSFSIDLPNPGIYNATTEWEGLYPWQNGTIFKGQVILNWGPGSKAAQSFNIQDETPESLIEVSGAIILRQNANPVTIRFNATNGQTFDTVVKSSIYLINLPNMMKYTISVKWEDEDGNIGWSDAGSVTIQASPGIKGQSLNLWPT